MQSSNQFNGSYKRDSKMVIRKAERKKAKLRLAIAGPSGSGKTWSALEIATGMGGTIGFIDTEAGRGELYGNNFNYDVIRLDAPYSPERYIDAIHEFEKADYDILIIDSLSHAWTGVGGVLSIVEQAGGQFQSGWKKGTPQQNALVDAITTSKMHIITTMRVKTEYVVEINEKGKNAPRKIGLAPVQRDQIEYEFTMFMNINQDHIAHISKDNTQLYDQKYIKPSKEMGIELIKWLNSGVEVDMQKTMSEQLQNDVDTPTMSADKCLDFINNASSMDYLQKVFRESQRIFKSDPNILKQLVAAKDKRKQALFIANDNHIEDDGVL